MCGDPIERADALCAVCLAPHHDRCWQYNQRCGIYGCASRLRLSREILAREPLSTADLLRSLAWLAILVAGTSLMHLLS